MILTDEQRRCRVCGYTVYGHIWLEAEPPNGECLWQHKVSTECAHAMDKARLTAELIKAGVLPAHP